MTSFARLLFSILCVCAGCTHYSKSLDKDFYSNIEQTKNTASFNFFSAPAIRMDDSPSAKDILNEFRKSNLFISEDMLYEDYVSSNNLLVDCDFRKKDTGIFGSGGNTSALAVLIPLPTYKDTSLHCVIRNKEGQRKEYKADFRYSVYLFIPLFPIGITQSFIYPSTYAEQILAQDILQQMNKAYENGSLL